MMEMSFQPAAYHKEKKSIGVEQNKRKNGKKIVIKMGYMHLVYKCINDFNAFDINA